MADTILVVSSKRTIFLKDEKKDKTIVFYFDYVQKSGKEFKNCCNYIETIVNVVRKEYILKICVLGDGF